MKKNYYEILEISENASQEIVEKAYKTLAMKYHPDLHGDSANGEDYEEKLKLINEAYAVLKDKEKRAEYDEKMRIEAETTSKLDNYDAIKKAAEKVIFKNVANTNKSNDKSEDTIENDREKAINEAYEKAYNDAYVQELKRRGFKVKYQKSLKDYIRVFIAIIIVILVLMLLWQIPFFRNYFIELYNNNSILQLILSPFFRN